MPIKSRSSKRCSSKTLPLSDVIAKQLITHIDRLEEDNKDQDVGNLLRNLRRLVCSKNFDEFLENFKILTKTYREIYADDNRLPNECLLFVFESVTRIYLNCISFRKYSIGFFRMFSIDGSEWDRSLLGNFDRLWTTYVMSLSEEFVIRSICDQLESILHVLEFPIGIMVVRNRLEHLIKDHLKSLLSKAISSIKVIPLEPIHTNLLTDRLEEIYLVTKCILTLFKRFPEETHVFWRTSICNEYVDLLSGFLWETYRFPIKDTANMCAMVIVNLIEMNPLETDMKAKANCFGDLYKKRYEPSLITKHHRLPELAFIRALLTCSHRRILLTAIGEHEFLLRYIIQTCLHEACQMSIEPVQRFMTFQTMTLYLHLLCELLKNHTGDFPSELELLVNDSEIDKFINYVFCYWDDPIEGVSHHMKQSFAFIMDILRWRPNLSHFTMEETNERYFRLAKQLLATDWSYKIRYGSLAVLLDHMNLSDVLKLDPNLVRQSVFSLK